MSDAVLKVYYNSACPVCKAGIEDQRARMEKRDIRGNAEWIDIACNAHGLDPLGLDVDTVRRSLHVHDGAQMHVGADAFIALAHATPGQAWIAELFGNKYMLPLSRFGYDRFADVLYWWNKKRGHW